MLTKTLRYNQADFYATAGLLEVIWWNTDISSPLTGLKLKTQDVMNILIETGLRFANDLYSEGGLKNDGTTIKNKDWFEYIFVTKVVAGSVDGQFHARAETSMTIRLVPEIIMARKDDVPEEDIVCQSEAVAAHFAIKDATDEHAQKET